MSDAPEFEEESSVAEDSGDENAETQGGFARGGNEVTAKMPDLKKRSLLQRDAERHQDQPSDEEE